MSILLAVGTDHRGYALKEQLKVLPSLKGISVRWHDVGAFSSERSDYPHYAYALVQHILSGHVELGILLCGSANGMAIAANRFKKIYAAVVWNEKIARQAREDDGANVLVLPADYLTQAQIEPIIHAWLTATFKGGRYHQRLELLDQLSSK